MEEDAKLDRDLPLIRLVRSTWLVKRAEHLETALAKAGDDEIAAAAARRELALPRRQDLPAEAFIQERDLRELTPKLPWPLYTRGRIAIAAVSQCEWQRVMEHLPSAATLPRHQ